jgi:uncharacterized membrane protein YkgB
VTGVLTGAVVWLAAYLGVLWFFIARTQLLIGGVASLVISFVPMTFGRATTPEEWHDSPLMGLYYLPTMLTGLLSLLLLIAGLVRLAMGALSGRSET